MPARRLEGSAQIFGEGSTYDCEAAPFIQNGQKGARDHEIEAAGIHDLEIEHEIGFCWGERKIIE
jgi:hypothetical protein